MTHTKPLLLTDEALEECVDGSTDPSLLREILGQPSVVQRDNKIAVKQFAKYFQMALEDLAENEEANENNYQWGDYRLTLPSCPSAFRCIDIL